LLESQLHNLAASFQQAALEVLVEKTARATESMNCRRVVLGGGVANSRLLRQRLAARISDGEIHVPSARLATDNAAMIARAGRFRFERGEAAGLDLTARADLPFPGLSRSALPLNV
jgi:N6-L-threonylcarbamoyladenine synthase